MTAFPMLALLLAAGCGERAVDPEADGTDVEDPETVSHPQAPEPPEVTLADPPSGFVEESGVRPADELIREQDAKFDALKRKLATADPVAALNDPGVQECYAAALPATPGLSGSIGVEVDVVAGEVAKVSTTSHGLDGTGVVACVEAVLTGLAFTPEVHETFTAEFVFKAEGGG